MNKESMRWVWRPIIAGFLVMCILGGTFVVSNTHAQNIEIPLDGTSPSRQMNPDVIVDSFGTIHMVYEDNRSGSWRIYYAKSVDRGRTFMITEINTNATGTVRDCDPKVAVDSQGIIHVVWCGISSRRSNIYYTNSTDGGKCFGKPLLVYSTAEAQEHPSIAVNDHGIYVVWNEMVNAVWRLYFATLPTGEKTFSKPIEIDRLGGYSATWSAPEIVVDNETIHVGWVGVNGTEVVSYARSTNNRTSFSKPLEICEDPEPPALAVGNNHTVHITWEKENTIYYMNSMDDGKTFSQPIIVNNSRADVYYRMHPDIAVDNSGDIHICWVQGKNDGSTGIYYTNSTNGGKSFGNNILIAVLSPGSQIHPQLAVIGDDVYVVWEDNINGDSDVFLSKIDGGLNATSPPMNLTATLSDSKVRLTWEAPLSDGNAPITEYTIYRGTSENSLEFIASVNGSIDEYLDSNVTKGEKYYYAVGAVNPVGESNLSEIVSIEIPKEKEPVPSIGFVGIIGVIVVAMLVRYMKKRRKREK